MAFAKRLHPQPVATNRTCSVAVVLCSRTEFKWQISLILTYLHATFAYMGKLRTCSAMEPHYVENTITDILQSQPSSTWNCLSPIGSLLPMYTNDTHVFPLTRVVVIASFFRAFFFCSSGSTRILLYNCIN